MVKTLPSSLAPYVDRLGPAIEAALRKISCLPTGCPDQLREAIRYSLLAPGKRLRPMLALMAAEACGGSLSAAMPAACAVEMIHTYSLIHDDLPAMDDDDLRRGRPTCHKVFGEAMATLAGDGLLSLAFQVLAEGIRPQTVAATCCAALAEASGPCQLVGGQADDIAQSQAGKPDVPPPTSGQAGKPDVQQRLGPSGATYDREHLESIHARKTGAMICVALRLGGMTAEAAPEQLKALNEYGRRLGLAFQITDDLLDVRSTEESMGKRVGKDAEKGKITFPGLLGVDESAAYAAQLIAEACAALEPLGSQAEGLVTLARYVLERNS
ncbi:MAG: polyprenyl synthetase family protein [Planctomycetota bacterium]